MWTGNADTGSGPVDGPGDRRFCAFAFTDVVGYSTLMSLDETGTHARWLEILNHNIKPLLQQYGGKLVKSTGDGVLVEFDGPEAAVQWSERLQRALQNEDPKFPFRSNGMELRISVNVGEVMDADGDIFGSGVNVAARLQEHAVPGGIVISDEVYETVRQSREVEARSLGYLRLKNLDTPVFAYEIAPEGKAFEAGVNASGESLPSIAVLPFQHLGNDPDDRYFSDGIVEDIIVSLSGLRELFVISRATTLRCSGTDTDPREAGRLLGVRYVLAGSVRRTGQSLRIATQLCDALTGEAIWGDSSEVSLDALFDVQDEIVARVVGGIAPHIRDAELRNALRKRPNNLSAYDATLKALDLMKSLERDPFMEARHFLDLARDYDPNFAMAFAWSARWYSLSIGQGWSETPQEDAEAAKDLASRALQLDRHNSLALATFGHLQSFLFHDYDTALIFLARAREASPSDSLAWILSSATQSYLGGERAVEFAERGLRLSPYDQNIFYYYNILSLAHFADGDLAAAVKWGKVSLADNPSCTATLRILIAALAAHGETAEAGQVAGSLLALEPDFRVDDYERTRLPFKAPPLRERFVAGLRAAGLPR